MESVVIFKLLGMLTTGFLLGVQHSFDADHVAAVSTIVSKNRSIGRSALVGAVWGLGHTATLLVIGLVVIVLKITIPEFVSRAFEFFVGLMLLYLGGALLKSVLFDNIHIHKHTHDGQQHIHLHSHKSGSKHDHLHKPFMIGIVHGLAGSAGIMLLVMATMTSIIEGLLFTLTFGLGSILGMVATGAIIGVPFLLAKSYERLSRICMAGIALATIIIGLFVAKQNWFF
jgi:high-affinity nickel permease